VDRGELVGADRAASSIGSPTTLRMRPSVLGPTGTEICAPVLVTPGHG
jgi:hypothetical protein